MESRTYYYARVSSKEQNLDRQLAVFKSMGATERDIITDKESGKDLERQGYQALKNAILRSGDTLVVKSLDRLSRNKSDIKNELQYFKDNGIRIKVLDLPTTLMEYPEGQEWVFDMVNNILIEVLGAIAEQERVTIHQRQAEGIAAAKAKGKHLGRPKAVKPDNWDDVTARWRRGEITAVKAMELTGLKRSTFYHFANDEKPEAILEQAELTAVQAQILKLRGEGLDTAGIAEALGVTKDFVTKQDDRIIQKVKSAKR